MFCVLEVCVLILVLNYDCGTVRVVVVVGSVGFDDGFFG